MPTQERAVVFSHTVKAFVETMSARPAGAAFLAQARSLGVEPARPVDQPIDVWWTLIDLAARTFFPGVEPAIAQEQVGRAMLQGFAQTLLGRSAFLVLRIRGPARGLEKLTEQFRLADSVTTISSTPRAERAVELRYQVRGGLRCPDYVRGLLLEGLKQVGAGAPGVTSTRLDDETCAFLVTW